MAHIMNLFEEKTPQKDYAVANQKLEAFRDLLKDPPEKLMGHIGILRLQMRENFNPNCLKSILRLRSDIPSDYKLAMFEILQEKEEVLKENDKARLGKMMGKSVMLEFRINQFVTKLRKKMLARKEFMQKRDVQNRDDEL